MFQGLKKQHYFCVSQVFECQSVTFKI